MNHEKYEECIDACNECAAACEHCATACGHEKDAQMQAKCVELDRYCADMCRMAAAFLARADAHTLEFVNKFVALLNTDILHNITTAKFRQAEG